MRVVTLRGGQRERGKEGLISALSFGGLRYLEATGLRGSGDARDSYVPPRSRVLLILIRASPESPG